MGDSLTVPAASMVGKRTSTWESIISAISVGVVFILFGVVYVLALPNNLWDRIIAFFGSLTIRQVPSTEIFLPAPIAPGAHTVFYTAVFQFCLGLVLLGIVVLVLRLMWGSPASKTAESLGNLVFWSGTAILINTFLNAQTTINTWFGFWAGVLITLGISLIVRALVLIVKK